VTAPDGCPVAVYAALPAEPELSIVLRHAAGRRTVLDLGCGTGRIADPLAVAGYQVVAVDESPEMLAQVRQATTVQSTIQTLELAERFDLVLAMSHLLNAPGPDRAAVLATCRRHLAADGLLLLQRHDPHQRLVASVSDAVIGEVRVGLIDVDDSAWPTVQATTVYRLGDGEWHQPWTGVILDDAATAAALERAGLEAVSIDAAWVTARRAREESDV
jgi:SAM-dependent methyltransferase